MNRSISVLVVSLVSILAIASIAAAQPTGDTVFPCSAKSGLNHQIFTLAQSAGSVDLQTCQRDCNIDYGVLPYYRGGSSSRWWMYQRCIQDCNSRFWKEYDREMRDLEEEAR